MAIPYKRAKCARLSGRWKGRRIKRRNYIKYLIGFESENFAKEEVYKGRSGAETKRLMNDLKISLGVPTLVANEASEHVIWGPSKGLVDVINDGKKKDLPDLQKRWICTLNTTSTSLILMPQRAVHLELRQWWFAVD